MTNCDCKHSYYCKVDPEKCNLEEEWKHFNEDFIFNLSPKKIMSLQGRPGQDLKGGKML